MAGWSEAKRERRVFAGVFPCHQSAIRTKLMAAAVTRCLPVSLGRSQLAAAAPATASDRLFMGTLNTGSGGILLPELGRGLPLPCDL